MPAPCLTRAERVEIRMQMGCVHVKRLADRYGVSMRTIRRVWNPDSRETKERNCIRRQRKYREDKEIELNVSTVTWRAKGLGDGRDALCRQCRRRFTEQDFTVDEFGHLIDPDLCSRCAG